MLCFAVLVITSSKKEFYWWGVVKYGEDSLCNYAVGGSSLSLLYKVAVW